MSERGTKRLFSIFKNNDDYDEEYEYEDGYDAEDDITPLPNYKSSTKVVNLGAGNLASDKQIKVMVFEPASFDEDAPAIVDSLKERKVCIVNLETIRDPEVAKSIFDFLNGAIYAMEGRIKKISKGIFLLAPDNTDIDGNIKKELETKGFFRWQ